MTSRLELDETIALQPEQQPLVFDFMTPLVHLVVIFPRRVVCVCEGSKG